MNDLLSSVFQNTLSAVFWALLAGIFLIAKNWWFEHRLRKSFSNHSISEGEDGTGIALKNPSSQEIVVRDVQIEMEERGAIVLKYTGPKEEQTERGYVTIPPYSSSSWVIPAQLAAYKRTKFVSVKVEFLYPTLFGSNKLVEINGDRKLIEHLNSFWSRTLERKGIKEGTAFGDYKAPSS